MAEAELFAFLCVLGLTHGWAQLKWLGDEAALIVRSPDTAAELYDSAVALSAGCCPKLALLMC